MAENGTSPAGGATGNPNVGTEGVKLFIGRIPKEAEEEQIRKVVEPFGEVVEVYVMKDRETKVSKGAAFVRFKTLPAAQAAIEGLNGQTSMDERLGPLSVSFASGESSRLGLDEGVLNAPEGQTKLFIGGLPFEFTKEQLNELFQVYGEIVDSHLMQDKQTGKSRGAAFVTYATKADALNAIESLKDYTIPPMTRALNVKFADRPGQKQERQQQAGGKGGGGGGYQQGGYQQQQNQYAPQQGGYQQMQQGYGQQQQAPPGTGSSSGDWTEYFTTDGRAYYHHRVTGVTQWERPRDFGMGGGQMGPPGGHMGQAQSQRYRPY